LNGQRRQESFGGSQALKNHAVASIKLGVKNATDLRINQTGVERL
jgi:hypothetical protein